jgi:hypothetical protein
MSQLERLARRVAGDPFFLASVLARYAESHGLDDDALAARLDCSAETLMHLRLCRNPDPLPPQFWSDVERIAGKFRVDADLLAQMIRLGQGLLRNHSPEAGRMPDSAGFLLAARDEQAEPLPPDQTEEEP